MSTQTTTTEAASGAEGFVLVPKQATKAMLDAAYAAHDAYEAAKTGGWGGLGSVYEAMIAAAPVTGMEGERSWLPMKDAPTGVPIIAKHKPNARMPLGWVATIKLGHRDEEEPGALDTILHYNGDDFYRGFHGCWDGWLPVGSAIQATAPQPAGAERVDLGELERLSAVATQGEWQIGRMADKKLTHVVDMGAPPKAPFMALHKGYPSTSAVRGSPDSGVCHSDDGSSAANAAFIVALVNAYRSGHLVPAALGRGEGTAGATLMGQATQQSPSPAVSALAGECPSRGSAATVEQIPIIRDALIQARGALHLDAMIDEAGKPYGTTTVALEAISVALAILDAAPNSEAALATLTASQEQAGEVRR